MDGHSHTHFDQAPVVNGVVVVQAGWGTRYLGRLDLEVQGGRVVSWDWRALPLDIPPPGDPSASIPPDRDMELLLTPYLWAGRTRLDQVVGRTEVFLKGDRGSIRGRGTNLGNWITDAFRDRGEAEGAFLNAGSVRDSLAAGDITMGDLLRVLPFPQTLTVFSLKGSEILEVLRYAASIPPGSGGTLLSSGVTALFRGGEVSDVRVGGLPLDPDRVYRIATTSYDGHARVWSTDRGDRLLDVRVETVGDAAPPEAYAAAFDPDGKRLFVGYADGRGRIYSLG